MDYERAYRFKRIEQENLADDLLLFLTVICHQPYSEARKMPLPIAIRLQKKFNEWISRITKAAQPNADPYEFNPGLPPIEEVLKERGIPLDQWVFE